MGERKPRSRTEEDLEAGGIGGSVGGMGGIGGGGREQRRRGLEAGGGGGGSGSSGSHRQANSISLPRERGPRGSIGA